MDYKGAVYLKKKLRQKSNRVDLRYKWYEMKNTVKDFNISTPPELRAWFSALGWCGKGVDSLADRLVFDKFKNDTFNMNQIFNMNNPDVLFDSAILCALIGSCSFVYISKDEDGYPRLQVIDGANATGIIDPFTNMLQEGYAVLERNADGHPVEEAYFIAGRTDYYSNGKYTRSIENPAPYPLLVPIIYRPDAKRPFGRSRISRACMSIQGSAVRTIKRSEISAEFYAYPQKYVTGLSQDAEAMEKWKATMSSMIAFTKDDDGDKPTVGQFQQQTMQPHLEQLRMFAGLFAGETGLTLDDLGFPSENPSSNDAIKAQHENLRLNARKAQRTFGTCFLNVGYLAACVRDDFPYLRNQVYNTKPSWKPIFEPDATTMSLIGDGVIKINQAIPNYFDRETLDELTGMSTDGSSEDSLMALIGSKVDE